MKIDKPSIGLSVALAAVAVLAVFSASFPASGTDATQNATVTTNITAIKVCAQNGSVDHQVNYWNFSGQSGAINDTPVNDLGGQQALQAQEGICTLNNTDNTYPMTTYISTSSGGNDWSNTNVIENGKTWCNYTDSVAPAAIDKLLNSTVQSVGSIDVNNNKSVWVKVQFKHPGSATSTFSVTAEA